MSGDPQRVREPAINMPPFLLGWIALLLGIQAVRTWLSEPEDVRLLLEFSFIPAPWSIAIGWASADDVIKAAEQSQAVGSEAATLRVALARYVAEEGVRAWSCISYAFLHGSWMHVGLNCVWLAAFGTTVIRRAGALRSSVLAVATALGGVVAQWISDPLGVQPVIGASAIVSGFMAAAATFIFTRERRPFWIAYQPGGRWDFLKNRNVLTFLGVWLLANLLFGVAAVPLGLADGAAVAWQAHVGGLVAGLLAFPFLDPGEGSRRDDARAS